ncbi:DNA polymerase-4 [Psychromicrobium silvestre]|uniref:DNA polymerase IV n=1 Tax=Psychromicrobium silvestre TaxID=1645614 RepID=A0A7Y9LQZ5_9MICC|nr:DNA polymerase IV [Psychromicrobium silvestre]NYE93958.1 DNA polymerase-4 [Psychromicrobium silvestre]
MTAKNPRNTQPPARPPSARQETANREEYRDCTILHVDMDAFFVAVEQRENPGLLGKPVIVGFPQGRSVVLSASYEARAFGVRSAMPMSAAIRLCPQAVIVEPRHQQYYQMSKVLMELFSSITDKVEPLSVDEAFLDVAGAMRRLGPPLQIAQLIRRRVKAELGVTASVGIAASKFVAKIASARCKPDGLLLIPKADTVAYLHTLPARALWGVGAKTMVVLEGLGVHTVEQIANTPIAVLRRALGASGEHVHRLAWGIDPREVTPVRVEKSIGAEETFAVDTAQEAPLRRELLRLAHRVGGRLRASSYFTRTVALKLRYADFSTISRSRTLAVPVDSAQLIYQTGIQLLEAIGERPMAVRLIGLRAEGLELSGQTSVQLSLERRDDNWRGAEAVIDAVSQKFGNAGVRPASLLEKPGSEEG